MRWTSSVRDMVKSSVKTINGVLLNVMCYPKCVCVMRVSCGSLLRSTGVWSQLNTTVWMQQRGGGAYRSSHAPRPANAHWGRGYTHLLLPCPGCDSSLELTGHWSSLFNMISLFYVSGLATNTSNMRNCRKQVLLLLLFRANSLHTAKIIV